MKLWLDDVRFPPDESWTWAKTAQEARQWLKLGLMNPLMRCSEASLDHDLGANPEAGIYARGDSRDGSGYDVVLYMIEHACVPPIVRIHSWNPDGAKRMAAAISDAGEACGAKNVLVEPHRFT